MLLKPLCFLCSNNNNNNNNNKQKQKQIQSSTTNSYFISWTKYCYIFQQSPSPDNGLDIAEICSCVILNK